MSYSLGFSPDFFFAEGEPYDRSDLALNAEGKPVSVWSALCKMREGRPDDWNNMAQDIFGRKGDLVSEETVLNKIRKTDTCSNLSVPVQVWIDPEGIYTVMVWE